MFEGYVGIRLWSGQLFGDTLFTILVLLLLVFAISARAKAKSFVNMFHVCFSIRSRLNPDVSLYYSKFLNSVLIFQTIVLSSLALVQLVYADSYTINIGENKLKAAAALTFGGVFFYYFCRRLAYKILIFIFAAPDYYQLWKLNYNSVVGIMGILMYIPVIGLSIIGGSKSLYIVMLVILYVLSRFAIIYKSIRLFSIKKFDLFYLSLYLCAHEILPLWIMYKGLIYLYNFIEKSAIWH